jgi:hypothetical protein
MSIKSVHFSFLQNFTTFPTMDGANTQEQALPGHGADPPSMDFFDDSSEQANPLDQEEGNEGAGNDKRETIAAKESKAVEWIRIIAIAVVVLSTLGVALAVYFYMTNSEKATFESRFQSDSYKILESIGATFDRSFGSVDSFAVNMVNSAKQSNQSWPYVTESGFPVESSKILTLSKGIQFSIYFYVADEHRPSWVNYTLNNDGWIDESLNVQEKALNMTYFGPIKRNWTKPKDIFHTVEETFKNEFYLAQWQNFPVIPAEWPPYGWDLWEYPNAGAIRMLETHRAAISPSFQLPDPNDADDVAYNEIYAEYWRDFLPPERNPSEPMGEMYYVRSQTVNLVIIVCPRSNCCCSFES